MSATTAAIAIAAAACARAASHEHARSDTDAAAERCSPCGTLCLGFDGDRIGTAAFRATGDAASDALLECFCREIEGLPREEAAACGASYVVYRLTGGAAIEGLAGVVNPAALHPALGAAENALRALRADWRAGSAAPALDAAAFLAIPAAWRALTAAERLAALRAGLAQAEAAGLVPAGVLSVERIEDDIRGRPVRATIGHAGDTDGLPPLMQALERHLRQQVSPWIEVYAEERQDHNKLRRTILLDQRERNG